MAFTRQQSKELADLVKTTLNSVLKDDGFISVIADKLFDKISSKIDELRQQYEEDIQEVRKENSVLEDKLDQLEQYSRRNCVRIFGAGEKKEETVEETVSNIMKKIGVNIVSDNLEICHRVGKLVLQKPRPILVKFSTYKLRQSVIVNRKHLKGTGITITEDLTKQRINSLNLAKKKFGPKVVWSVNGNIYVFYKNIKHNIKCETDLDEIYNT